MNNYFFSIQYGIGILLEEINASFKIAFKDEIKLVKQNEVINLSDDVASKLEDNDFKNYFNYHTIQKAQSYIGTGKILRYYIMGKTLSGTIYGTNVYRSEVVFNKNSISTRCTCPVSIDCKHSYAIIGQLVYDINEIKKKYAKEITSSSLTLNSPSTYPKEAVSYVEAYKKTQDEAERIKLTKQFETELKFMSADEIISTIKLININYSPTRYSFVHLKRLVICNMELFSILRENDSILQSNSFYNQILMDYHTVLNMTKPETLFKEKNKLATELDIELAYYLGLYKEEIMVIKNNYFLYNNAYLLFEEYYDLDIKEILLSRKIRPSSRLLKAILDKSNYDLDLINFFSKYIDFKDLDLSKIPYDIKLNYLKENEDPELISDLIANFNEYLNLDSIKTTKILINLYDHYEIDKGTFKRKLKLVPHNQYIEAIYSGSYIDEDELDIEAFKYFDIDINYEYYIEPFSSFYFENRDYKDIPIIEININLGKYDVLTNLYDYEFKFVTKKACIYFSPKFENKIINYILDNEEFKKNVERVKKENEQKLIESITSKYLNSIDNFVKDDAPALAENFKAHLTLELMTDEGEASFSLKVGVTKDYVVKDIEDFLDDVKESRVVSYGKSLKFNHNIDNFEDRSKKIIELLINNKTIYDEYNQRTKKLDDQTLEAIIDLYKDDNLIVDSKNYNVRLAPIPFKARIDSDYILSTNYDILFTGRNKLYVKNNNYIDSINSSKDKRAILFLNENKGMNVSYVLDKFKENIYYKYRNLIDVDETLTTEFRISELEINAYFDYENKEIFLDTKLAKDGSLILRPTDKNDIGKYNAYLAYIDKLGFKNGILSNDDDMYAFFTMDFTELKTYANVYLSEELQNKKIMKLSLPQIRIQYESSMMEAIFDESSFTDEELYKILQGIKKKKKFIILNKDRIIDITSEEAKSFYDTVEDLNLDMKHLSEKKQIPVYQSLKAIAHENMLSVDDYVSNMINELVNFKKAKIALPNIKGDLRDYQRQGFNFLSILSKYNLGGILADDMGLGKTLEVITLIESDETKAPSLIVCPKSLSFNWLSEFEKFTDDYDNVTIIYGNQNERNRIIKKIKNDVKHVYITGYDSLRNDVEVYSNSKINFNYIILDEAQYIKNVEALKSKSVKLLSGKHKFALTGTPIENNILDLWSIFDFLMPGYLGDIADFKDNYLHNDEFKEEIAIKVAPFILRRTKGEVLKDLPPKFERIISCEMTRDQRKIYDAVKFEASNTLAINGKAFDVLPYLMRLRQICVDPHTYIENYEGQSGKMMELEAIIENTLNEGKKMLIFSSFVKALNIIEDKLVYKGIKYFLLTGDTKLTDRKAFVDEFNNDEETKVFLISLKAGGVGLNLIGAEVVVHLDPWWNVAAMDQATDRAHRIGQKKNVEVIKLVSENSIEQRVIELQNMKKDLIDKIISNNDESITNFKIEDLKFILD